MTYENPEALVSTEWLAEHMSAPDVRIVDATSFLPTSDRDGKAEYNERHIPGAVYFDINDIADETSDLPHMLPSPEKFSSKARKLGLGDGNRIVVYDANGGYLAAARVWWTFRVFGHKDVVILDGGLPKWIAEGRALDDLPTVPRERHFTAHVNHTLVRDREKLIENIKTKRKQVIDARSAGRFTGTDPEPRATNKTGHIPGSLSLPFNKLMDPDNHFVMRSGTEIRAAIDEAGIDMNQPIVASCGTGVTACVIALGFYLIGRDDVAVYDGSWAEWGNHPSTPVEF